MRTLLTQAELQRHLHYDTLEEAASHRKFAEWVLGFHTNHGRTV